MTTNTDELAKLLGALIQSMRDMEGCQASVTKHLEGLVRELQDPAGGVSSPSPGMGINTYYPPLIPQPPPGPPPPPPPPSGPWQCLNCGRWNV